MQNLCLPHRIVGRFFAGLLALSFCASQVPAEGTKMVVLGVRRDDNAEMVDARMLPVYREHGIQPGHLDESLFSSRDCSEEQLLAMMKQFHVVHLVTLSEGIPRFDEPHKKRAAIVSGALARYVAEGGGLFLQPQPVRYANTEDQLYWNAVLAPLGKDPDGGDFRQDADLRGNDALQGRLLVHPQYPAAPGHQRRVLPLSSHDEIRSAGWPGGCGRDAVQPGVAGARTWREGGEELSVEDCRGICDGRRR